MGKADPELDDLQREIDEATARYAGKEPPPASAPFIHRPEELDVRQGMLCWLDGARVCGADCVAFNTEEIDPQTGELLQGPNKCLFLLYTGQQGAAALSVIALNRRKIQESQDKRRQAAQGPPPPDPTGGKR